ncbi:follistatin-related protein 5-like [Octopus sinensis]|uniref:Follistatin-related protein 5-like n=1 Tax=Octopus sinensis TaxID=2607531 RepID=A0A6P7S6B2_9MOLL|nr:follistatin-related protein 5-like [Octopus sinensis]XP_036356736.1 follistatin-related protein 5-like [Octopus sinensis]
MSGKTISLCFLSLWFLVGLVHCWPHVKAKVHHGKYKEHTSEVNAHHRKIHPSHRWMNLETADFLPEKGQDENWKKQDSLSDNFYNWEDNGIWESQSDVLSKGKLKKLHNLHKFKTTAKSGTQPESSTTTGIKTTTTSFSEPSKKDNFLKYEESDNLKQSTDGHKKRLSYSEEEPMGINNGFFEDTIENTGQIFVGDVKKTTGSGKKVEIEYKTKVTASVEPQRAVPKPANLVHPGFTTKKDTVTIKTLKKLPNTKRVTPAVPAAQLAKKHHAQNCEDDLDCRSGRVCKSSTCVCADEDYCWGLSKPVCGSDGTLYPSHCELHRVACVIEKHIKVDPKGTCLHGIQSKPLKSNSEKKPANDQSKDTIPTTTGPAKQQQPSGHSSHSESMKHEDIIIKASDNELKSNTDHDDPCNKLEYLRFKEKLLHFHCERFQESDCNQDTKEFKQYLATLMFSYYDDSLDNFLQESELLHIEEKEQFKNLSAKCSLLNMLPFEDTDHDNKISFKEFISAFNVPGLLLDEKLRIIPTLATVDNGLEIKCGIKGSSEIVWRRNNIDLHKIHNPEIMVFDDGSLYISSIGIHHIGNYSCHDKEDASIKQTHVLKVHMPPKVMVSPSTQLHKSHSDVVLKCHAEGIPRPELSWEINEMPLPNNAKHYIRQHENGTLVIHNANYLTDTGAYKCTAQNQAGKAQGVSTVFIQNPNSSQSLVTTSSYHQSFLVFHEEGYIVYEPNDCVIRRDVGKDYGNFKFIPENLDAPPSLCEENKPCSWGSAVNIKNKYIYISQPRQSRVVVVEITHRWNPVQVIYTDKDPVSMFYIESLDQVWVLCWNNEVDTGSKTIVVIREASQDKQHHAVHTQPIGNRFDLVNKLFLPPSNTLHPTFLFGYVIHSGQRGLFKLDIEEMKYIKNIDLNQYNCEPENLAFIPLGGQIVIQCHSSKDGHQPPLQLILDYITDNVIANTSVSGIPYVSPDSQYLVNVNKDTGLITVSRISEEGEFGYSFTVSTGNSINDIAFFPSSRNNGYDIFMTSGSLSNIIYVNLDSGAMNILEGIGRTNEEKSWPWLENKWSIIGGNVFSEYLLTSMKYSVIILNGHMRQVQCEFRDLKKSDVAIFAEPYEG